MDRERLEKLYISCMKKIGDTEANEELRPRKGAAGAFMEYLKLCSTVGTDMDRAARLEAFVISQGHITMKELLAEIPPMFRQDGYNYEVLFSEPSAEAEREGIVFPGIGKIDPSMDGFTVELPENGAVREVPIDWNCGSLDDFCKTLAWYDETRKIFSSCVHEPDQQPEGISYLELGAGLMKLKDAWSGFIEEFYMGINCVLEKHKRLVVGPKERLFASGIEWQRTEGDAAEEVLNPEEFGLPVRVELPAGLANDDGGMWDYLNDHFRYADMMPVSAVQEVLEFSRGASASDITFDASCYDCDILDHWDGTPIPLPDDLLRAPNQIPDYLTAMTGYIVKDYRVTVCSTLEQKEEPEEMECEER